ncbi:MAG TPA: DM13 domain-containing protein [Tepidiformaceae bacterium]|nr:DM13 domain-containing protein [Tepidiformaceae bacterium]
MPRLIERMPWYVSAPVLGLVAVVVAVLQAQYVGPYFERTFLDEADPLAGVVGTAVPATGTAAAGGTLTPAAGTATPATGPSQAAVLAEGEFRDGEPGHNGAGRARLIRTADGALVLRFEEFSVTNGPDLFVVLSTDPEGSRGSASEGLNLGDLKATDGNINYEIPGGTDVSTFRSVIIWCRQFNVVFAVATLDDEV